MSSSAGKINALLKKTSHHDKDERFMATSDLITELESYGSDGTAPINTAALPPSSTIPTSVSIPPSTPTCGIILDASLQASVSKAILGQLDDGSTDVQTVAIKALAVLVRKISLDQLYGCVDKLCLLLTDPSKSESHDLYSIGLKTLILSVSDSNGDILAPRIARSLIDGLQKDVNTMGILDVLRDLLQRHGHVLSDQHNTIVEQVAKRLESPEDSIRKRANQVIGVLAVHLNDKTFSSLMNLVIDKINALSNQNQGKNNKKQVAAAARVNVNHGSNTFLYTYLQTVSTLCQSAGSRVGKYLPKLLPPLETFCNNPTSTQQEDEVMMQLWENCLQAFESILLRCPNESTPYVNNILNIAIEFTSLDPNYAYTDDDVSMNGNGADDGGSWDDELTGDDGWGDDGAVATLDDGIESDDYSWQVRRSAIRVLSAFIKTKSDSLGQYYDKLLNVLISRFNERDSNVKLSVLACTSELIRESVIATRRETTTSQSVPLAAVNQQPLSPSSMDVDNSTATSHTHNHTTRVTSLVRQRSSFAILDKRLPAIVQAAVKAYNTTKIDIKVAVLSLLKDIVFVCKGFPQNELRDVIPIVQNAIVESEDVRTKSEALTLLRYILEFHSAAELSSFMNSITVAVCNTARASYLKIKADGVRTAGSVAQALTSDQTELIRQLYAAVNEQLQIRDIDNEVKEASLYAASILLSRFGNVLHDEFVTAIPILRQRLSNDLTRLAALRAITTIAQSPYAEGLAALLEDACQEFASFLRKESAALRTETVKTLTTLLHSASVNKKLTPKTLSCLLNDTVSHINPTDLHLSSLIVGLISSILQVHQSISAEEVNAVITQLLRLLESPVLQTNAMKEIARVFQQIVTLSKNSAELQNNNITFTALQDRVIALSNINSKSGAWAGATHSQLAQHIGTSIAQCIASMSVAASQNEVDQTIQRFASVLQDKKSSIPHKQIALLVIGQIGAIRDLSTHKEIQDTVYSLLNSTDDTLRQSAAYSLGNLSTGNLSHYVPLLLSLTQKHVKQQFLLFAALKELIHRFSSDPSQHDRFKPYVKSIAPTVFDSSDSNEEGVRTSVAECLGGLAIIDSAVIFPRLLELVSSQSANIRTVIVTAIRYALPNQHPSESSIQLLHQHLPTFLTLLKDTDLSVRRQTLLTLNVIAHAHPKLLSNTLQSQLLPVLYHDITPDPSLVRTVDLGPFKHKVDDGLPIRKAAYICMDTLLDYSADAIDRRNYFSNIIKGVADHDDVAIQTYGIIVKLATYHPTDILQAVDKLPPLIMKGVRDKLKEAKGADASTSANSPEGSQAASQAERAKDVLRAAVRAILSINKIQDIDTVQAWTDFYARVLKTALLVGGLIPRPCLQTAHICLLRHIEMKVQLIAEVQS